MRTRTKNSNAPYLTPLYKKVKEKLYKTSKPYEYVTTKHPPDVKIIPNANVNQRLVNTNNYEWQFTLYMKENKLRNVLIINHLDHRKIKFDLIEVLAGERSIGRKNKLEWYLDQDEALTLPQPENYTVKIKFESTLYLIGVYRADVIYHFGDWPVTLMRLCVQYTTNERAIQCEKDTNTYSSQISWHFDKNSCIFHTEDDYDKREINMSDVYPYPDRQNFFLTHDITSYPTFRESFSRSCLHEKLYVEEINQNFEISKFDQIVVMNIMSEFDIQDIHSPGYIIRKIALEGLYGQLRLTKKLDDSRIGTLIVNKCRYVLLGKRDRKDIRAPIVDKGAKKIYIRLNPDCVRQWHLKPQDEMYVTIRFVLDRLNFCNWHWAVDSLNNLDNLIPKTQKIRNPSNATLLDMNVPTADLRQRLIMQAIISEKTPSPIVVRTSYGTGKKYMIAHSIKHLLVEQNCKILLCTNTNTIADLYISQYFHDFYETKNPRLKPIRIYDKRCLSKTVDQTVLQYCLMDDKGRFREPTETDFQTSSCLIVTTQTIAMCLVDLNLSLTHIIIEEAGTIAIWKALIPLVLANRNTHIIYVGDKHHIPPEIYINRIHKMEHSILHWILKTVFQSRDHQLIEIKYETVHRMPVNIIEYLSKFNYPLKYQKLHNITVGKAIVKFYAVSGEEDEESTGMQEAIGYKNDEEAVELAKRVGELKNNWPESFGAFGKNSIRVFTRDTAQIYKLQRELRALGIGEDVIVEDVYNACGTEYPAVFISTVRSSRSKKLNTCNIDDSFVLNRHLIMLAISRTMHFVAVVGDPIALLTYGSDECKRCWKEYIELVYKEHDEHTKSLYGIEYKWLSRYLDDIPGTSR